MEELITRQIETAQQLHDALVRENSALQAREAEEVQSLSSEKARLTEQLEALCKQQNDLLAARGLPLNRDGLNRFIQQLAPKPATTALDDKLKTLGSVLESCKKQNLINGQMIAATRQSVEVALSILRGQNGPRELTYGPAGETLSNTGGGSLAKA